MREKFLGQNWLLDTVEGVKLYHDVAVTLRKEVGIIDTHTHHNLRQIVENKPFPNIWRAEVLETKEETIILFNWQQSSPVSLRL